MSRQENSLLNLTHMLWANGVVAPRAQTAAAAAACEKGFPPRPHFKFKRGRGRKGEGFELRWLRGCVFEEGRETEKNKRWKDMKNIRAICGLIQLTLQWKQSPSAPLCCSKDAFKEPSMPSKLSLLPKQKYCVNIVTRFKLSKWNKEVMK